jgi:hypothetical protein
MINYKIPSDENYAFFKSTCPKTAGEIPFYVTDEIYPGQAKSISNLYNCILLVGVMSQSG